MVGIPPLAGREIERSDAVPADSLNGEVPVVIGPELARRLWGSANPLGQRLRPASDTVRGRCCSRRTGCPPRCEIQQSCGFEESAKRPQYR
jgi:hypothetical protein